MDNNSTEKAPASDTPAASDVLRSVPIMSLSTKSIMNLYLGDALFWMQHKCSCFPLWPRPSPQTFTDSQYKGRRYLLSKQKPLLYSSRSCVWQCPWHRTLSPFLGDYCKDDTCSLLFKKVNREAAHPLWCASHSAIKTHLITLFSADANAAQLKF